jgi:hypothetical protein
MHAHRDFGTVAAVEAFDDRQQLDAIAEAARDVDVGLRDRRDALVVARRPRQHGHRTPPSR